MWGKRSVCAESAATQCTVEGSRKTTCVPVCRTPTHGQQSDAVEGLGGIDRLLPQGIDEAAQASRRIQHPLRLTIQGIFDLDQIAQFIGEGRLIIQRVFDRDRLALGIDREGRGLVQCIGDRREIALGIITERRRVSERIGDGCRSARSNNASISFVVMRRSID